jgi:predicted SprT family Zn-dependent metalloprotease
VETQANAMIKEYDLQGWTFGFDRALSRCGNCNFQKQIISLSKHFVDDPEVKDETITDVLIHECAHVIAGWQAGHGIEWVMTAQSMGGSGTERVNYYCKIPYKHIVKCECGQVVLERRRLHHNWDEVYCPACNRVCQCKARERD